MINPRKLNFAALPWVPLDATAGFPQKPGIYFAMDGQGIIQYIGRTQDVRGRWKQHHRYDDLSEIGGVRIVYLFFDAPEVLPEVETALIKWFDPPLNAIGRKTHSKDVLVSPKKVNPKSLKNLVDRSAPDSPGETKATTIRIGLADLEWLNSQPEGKSFHVRQALKLYREQLEGDDR